MSLWTGSEAVTEDLLTVEVSQPGDGVVELRCEGDVDVSSVDRLAEAIDWSFTPALRVLRVDLRAVGFMDSSGVQCMMGTRERCADLGVRLEVLASKPVVRLFILLGLDLLDGFDSLD
jgi:anti-anti-sigma factor